MTLLAVALATMLGGPPAPTPATTASVDLGFLHLGMSRDEALRTTPCRLSRPPGRSSANDLACSNFKLGTEKMELRLSFLDDRLTLIGLSRTGYSELRARQEIDVVLSALAGQFGPLGIPQMAADTVTTDIAFAHLKRMLSHSTMATLTIAPVKEIPGLSVTARFSLSRGPVARPDISEGRYESPRGPVAGSPFDLVTHNVSVTIRSTSSF
jgi:hypothetical protein